MMTRKCVLTHKEDLLSFVLLARYRKTSPQCSDSVYCSLERIARLLNISASKVRSVCVKYFASKASAVNLAVKKSRRIKKMRVERKQSFGQLTHAHIEFLTS